MQRDQNLLIRVAFNLDDRWSDLELFLERAATIVTPTNHASWTLDLRDCAYLGPDAAVLIAGLFDRDRQRGLVPRVVLPEGPEPLRAFCSYVGLAHRIGQGPRPTPDHPRSETVPLHTYYQPIANAERKVVRLVHEHFPGVTEGAELALGVAINEVIQNVCDHAESPIGALMAARYFQTRRDVRVAILDLGLGIPRTLARVLPAANDPQQALRLVVQGGVSSRSKASNMGLGVSNLVAQVRGRRGELLLLSARGVARMTPDGVVRYDSAPVDFPGTAVFFRMAVDDVDT